LVTDHHQFADQPSLRLGSGVRMPHPLLPWVAKRGGELGNGYGFVPAAGLPVVPHKAQQQVEG
jgi:hypothetical protein